MKVTQRIVTVIINRLFKQRGVIGTFIPNSPQLITLALKCRVHLTCFNLFCLLKWSECEGLCKGGLEPPARYGINL